MYVHKVNDMGQKTKTLKSRSKYNLQSSIKKNPIKIQKYKKILLVLFFEKNSCKILIFSDFVFLFLESNKWLKFSKRIFYKAKLCSLLWDFFCSVRVFFFHCGKANFIRNEKQPKKKKKVRKNTKEKVIKPHFTKVKWKSALSIHV